MPFIARHEKGVGGADRGATIGTGDVNLNGAIIPRFSVQVPRGHHMEIDALQTEVDRVLDSAYFPDRLLGRISGQVCAREGMPGSLVPAGRGRLGDPTTSQTPRGADIFVPGGA